MIVCWHKSKLYCLLVRCERECMEPAGNTALGILACGVD